MISLLARLPHVQLATLPDPIKNRFHDVLIHYDKESTLAISYLQRLIALDQKIIIDFFPIPLPCDCTAAQLFRLSVILPGRDPESGLASGPLLLTNSQHVLLRKYVAHELRWMNKFNRSRLPSVELPLIKHALLALMDALQKNRTRILTWSELCKLKL